ncbi:MAG TPA: hypothetical protein VFW25_06945 [Silvibacterium sp.]|nr:hypothetical protein [Silvibacterium sp.]
MKRITAVAFFTLASILGAGRALAQSHQVQATVPFDFTVGANVLPSGTYTIESVSDNGIEIRSSGQRSGILALAFVTSDQSLRGDELVFEKHAGRYSLREILCESGKMNVSVPAGNWKKGSRMEEAKLQDNSGQVLIAAK